MSPETLTLIFNYGVPLGLLVLGLVYGVPYAQKKLDEVLADHRAVIQKLTDQNSLQLNKHLDAERLQRNDYLSALEKMQLAQNLALKEMQAQQNAAIYDLVKTVDDMRGMLTELSDDFRSWNGVERRRVRRGEKNE